MNNSEKYHFEDFTFKNYRNLLRIAKTRFSFQDYTSFNQNDEFILWRHDVDFSIHSALNLARIEAEENVISTFFLYPHCEFYNLLEKEITDKIKEIVSLGHRIGLHFDVHYYSIKEERQLGKYLSFEKKLLEEIFEIPVQVFSFHNTTDFTMNCKDWQYAGMINTYANYFQENVAYCSDSNGYWRFKRLEDVIADTTIKRLQVLTHPAWWQEKVMSPKERIWLCIDGRAESNKKKYREMLTSFNREIIDWN